MTAGEQRRHERAHQVDPLGARVGRGIGGREFPDLRAGEPLVGARAGQLRERLVAPHRRRQRRALGRRAAVHPDRRDASREDPVELIDQGTAGVEPPQHRAGPVRQVDAAVLLAGAGDGADLREVQPARGQDTCHPVERGRPHHRRRRDDAPAVPRDVDPVAGAVFRKGRVEFEHVLEQDPAVGARDLDDRRGQALCARVEAEVGCHIVLRFPSASV